MEQLRLARPADGFGFRAPPLQRSPAAFPLWFDTLRPAGNRAIAAALSNAVQRQPVLADPDVALLDAAQIADAKRYYRVQPWLYTPAIIVQIRTSLGLDADGGIDDALTLAVARFQQDEGTDEPELKIDGKAGPRTLPRIFRRGLNVVGEGRAFGEETQTQVVDEWVTLATAEARLCKLAELVNAKLASKGVPPVRVGFDTNPVNLGSFAFDNWAMLIGRPILDAPALSEDQARQITETMYHEARHTEQWFRMAQMRAGQGLTARAIVLEMGIPIEQARLAKAAPLARGTIEAVIAQGWFDSVYGDFSAHRERVLTEIECADVARDRAKAKADADPSPANTAALAAAQERRDRAFAAYQELPEENDAFATEHEAGEGISSGSPGTPGTIPEGPIGECPTERPPGTAPPPEPPFVAVPCAPGAPVSTSAPPSHGTLPEANLPPQ